MKQHLIFIYVIVQMFIAQVAKAQDYVSMATEPSDGRFYLYNVNEEMFFNGVNPPRLSASPTDAITLTVKEDGYLIKCQSGYAKTGYWDGQYLWTDDATLLMPWKVKLCNEDKVYEIYTLAAIVESGCPDTEVHNWTWVSDSRVNLSYDEEAIVEGGTWMFIPAAPLELQTLIDDVTEKYYNNTDYKEGKDDLKAAIDAAQKTLDEKGDCEAAITALNDAVKNFNIVNTDTNKPADLTSFITNPTFDSNVAGWTNESGAGLSLATSSSSSSYLTDGYMNIWGSNCYGKIYQKVSGMPNGLYIMSTVVSANTNNCFIYANDESVEAPSNNGHLNLQVSELTFQIKDGTMEIGLDFREPKEYWAVADNFKLTYYGQSLEAYKMYRDRFLENAPEITEETLCQTAAAEQYNNVIREALAAATIDDVMASVEPIRQAIIDINANMAAYQLFDETYKAAEELLNEISEENSLELADFLLEIEDVLSEKKLSTGEISELTQKLTDLMEKASFMDKIPKGEATLDNPIDYTVLLVNPSFEGDSNEGWEGTSVQHAMAVSAGQFWNDNGFDFHQSVANLPEGLYSISVCAFYRAGWATDDAYTDWKNGNDPKNVCLYANAEGKEVSVAVKSIFDDASEESLGVSEDSEVGVYTPNNMEATVAYFQAGKYNDNKIYIYVPKGKTLTLGMRKTECVSEDWTMFDDFKLFYHGNDEEVAIKSVDATDDVKASDIIYNMSGQRVSDTYKGIVITNGKKFLKK